MPTTRYKGPLPVSTGTGARNGCYNATTLIRVVRAVAVTLLCLLLGYYTMTGVSRASEVNPGKEEKTARFDADNNFFTHFQHLPQDLNRTRQLFVIDSLPGIVRNVVTHQPRQNSDGLVNGLVDTNGGKEKGEDLNQHTKNVFTAPPLTQTLRLLRTAIEPSFRTSSKSDTVDTTRNFATVDALTNIKVEFKAMPFFNKEGLTLQNGVILLFIPGCQGYMSTELVEGGGGRGGGAAAAETPTGTTEACGTFAQEMLPRLENNVLSRHPYPVHFFHDGPISLESARALAALVPSATHVTVEDVSGVFLSESFLATDVAKTVQQWYMDQHRLFTEYYITNGDAPVSRGAAEQAASLRVARQRQCFYRRRFWLILAWRLPSLAHYEFYWRLHPASRFDKPVSRDVFASMAENQCVLGYHNIYYARPRRTTQLMSTLDEWTMSVVPRGISETALEKVMLWLLDDLNEYSGKSYDSDFLVGSFAMHEHALYQAFMTYVDNALPYGLVKYQWSADAVQTVAVEMVAMKEQWNTCFFDMFAGYQSESSINGIYRRRTGGCSG